MSDEPVKHSKPVEQTSLSIPFFVAALAFFLFSAWAVYQELVSRRVWKRYQAQFTDMESARLKTEIQAEMDRLQGKAPAAAPPAGEEKLPPLPEIERKLAEALAAAQTPEFEAVQSKIAAKEREVFLATQEWKIAKSNDVEHVYFYEEAQKEKHEAEIAHFKAALDHDAEEIARTEKALEGRKAELSALQAEREKLLAEVAKWEEMKKTATRELVSLEDKLRRVEKPFFVPDALWYEGTIQQVVLRGYQKNEFGEDQYTIDRCQSCHFAADKGGYTDAAKVPPVLRTHPDHDELLGKHPVKKFACTPCHNGQGMAVSTTTTMHSDLDEAHGTFEFWEHPVLGFVPQGEGHKFKEKREPAYTQAACFKCHANQYEIPGKHAEMLNAGREYVTKLGCWGCHNVKYVGDQSVGFTGKKVAPSLGRVTYKVSADWLVSWIENPQAHLERSRMPQYPDFGRYQADGVTRDEAAYRKDIQAVAAFLVSQSDKSWPEYDQDKRSDSYFTSGSAGRGEKLFQTVGCQGCHAVGARPAEWAKKDNLFFREFDPAPDLYNTGNKIKSPKWVFHWIKDPRGYDPATAMPSLRLSDSEALDLTTYLWKQRGKAVPKAEGLSASLSDEGQLKRGEWIVKNYGCYGCHNIRGMENEGKIAVDLSAFGNKREWELSFGVRSDVPPTWEDWTINKLRDPRGFRTERQQLKMPHFHFSREGAEAIRVLLKAFTAPDVGADWRYPMSERQSAIEKGRALVEQYNCKGCHVVDGKGGRILAYEQFQGANANLGPPQLWQLGAKLQPDWFYDFLLAPKPVRGWVRARMPTFPFTPEEARRVVQYFEASAPGDALNPFVRVDVETIDPASVAKGRQIFGQFRCQQCHMDKSSYTQAEATMAATDLRMAYQRLNPEFIKRWVMNPSKIWPGARMPSFWYFQEDSHGNLITDPSNPLAAKAVPEVESVRDFLLVYGQEAQVGGKVGAKRKGFSRR